ncbi:MAG: anti-sigma factor family protein [Candidatus Eiseniibacteriota bacterium]
MKTRCPESERIEPWLDGELPSASARAFEAHLDGCGRCEAELRALESMVASLRALPVRDPGPVLTERILDRVLPSRVRRHQVVVLGWCYTAVSAVTTFGFISWAVRPETHVLLGRLVSAAYGRLIDTGLFTLDAIMAVALRLQKGWGLMEVMGGWVLPVLRALAAVASDPWIAGALWGAVACSAALLWWIKPRPIRVLRGNRHVGILAL